MTVNELIARFDEDRNNDEKFENKLNWIREIEEIILTDVILTHENTIEEPETYFDEWGTQSELLAPLPYIDLYVNYMDMKMQLKLNQLKKYNNASMMFNNSYIAYQQYYNRHNKPLQKKNWIRHEVL